MARHGCAKEMNSVGLAEVLKYSVDGQCLCSWTPTNKQNNRNVEKLNALYKAALCCAGVEAVKSKGLLEMELGW